MQARSTGSNKRVAEAVRRLRRSKGLSQEAFAEKCGLHRTYVGSIERAEGNITLDTLDRIAEALSVEPLELLRSKAR